MTKRMLIDATHAEETRVVVLDGNRLEDFDVETSTKKQLKGNIYLAKVVRVEPSLQAAFVEYGGGRHGFLAFGEIHPDYYQIPVADRQRLLEIAAEEAREEEEAEDRREAGWAVRSEGPGSKAQEHSRRHDPVPPLEAEAEAAVEPDTAVVAAAVIEAESVAGEPVQEPVVAETEALVHPEPEHHVANVIAAREPVAELIAAPPAVEEATAVSQPVEEALAAPQPVAKVHASEILPPQSPEIPTPQPPSEVPAPELPPEAPEPAPDTVPAPSQEPEIPHNPEPGPDTQPEPPRTGPAQAAMIPTDTRYGDADAVASEPQPGLAFDDAPSPLPANVSYAGDAEGAVDDAALPEDTSGDEGSDTIEIATDDTPPPETIGGESDQFEGNGAEEASKRRSSRMLRSYRIQEVIRRRQILLIQVVKEERGTKGAALTTYISLAGRYCVLMPNSPRGGGISRKITSAADRKRLKEITNEMEIPKGMGLIVRTAGANRPKPEIRRDCEYLMRLWDDIREHTLRSMAPALIYEEASLIKRSIRDVYSRDVDEIIVDGEEGWKQAHDFMRMLMPSHAKKVQLWRPQGIQTPLFAKHQVDLQLDAMLSPTVQLKSGGYLVINQTEALVAIDVNSGRSTRERGIEETALKTNLEAAEEVARQLRLRDLAGLIVIDFIDMEARRANTMVEKRMKDALKNDRARIQLGSISHFGLMEMSRQRLRPSLAETSFVTCPHCNGLGHVRSVESAAIHVLRSVEEEGSKLRAAAILVYAASPVVMYILNHKRERLTEIEARYAMRISFAGDDTLLPPAVRIDRLRAQVADAERLLAAVPVAVAAPVMDDFEEEDEDDLVQDETPVAPRVQQPRQPQVQAQAAASATPDATVAADATTEEGEQRKRRRRRRRGGRRDGATPGENGALGFEGVEGAGEEDEQEDALSTAANDDDMTASALDEATAAAADAVPVEDETVEAVGGEIPVGEQGELDENGEPRARRRGRRGGRRRRRTEGGEAGEEAAPGSADADATSAPVHVAPAYVGPTPADPFNNTYDIFDMLEQAEQAAEPASSPSVKHVPIMPHKPVEETDAIEAVPPEPTPAAMAPVPVTTATQDDVASPETAETMVEMAIATAAETIETPVADEAATPEVPVVPPAPAKRGWWRR